MTDDPGGLLLIVLLTSVSGGELTDIDCYCYYWPDDWLLTQLNDPIGIDY